MYHRKVSFHISNNASLYDPLAADTITAAGEEILLTYGAHSNDKLLVHYGFVCSYLPGEANTDDDIRLDHLLLPKMTETVRDQLQDVGFLGGYALLPGTNELCFKTQVAARASLLTCNEWEYFIANGEDLASDQTAAVKARVGPLLREYRRQAVERLEELDGVAVHELAKGLIAMRWEQIKRAIDTFLDE